MFVRKITTLVAMLCLPAVAWAGTAANVGQGVNTGNTFVSTAAAPCSQTCQSQIFAADPFATEWSVVGADPDCTWSWTGAGTGTMKLLKTTSGVCNDVTNGFSYVRFNHNISRDGCALFQVKENEDGPGGTGTWGFGLIARDISTSNTNPFLGSVPKAQCNSETCDLFTLQVTQFPGFLGCIGMPAFAVDDWLGVCVSGAASSDVNVFHIAGPADPGAPVDISGGGGWGSPECSFSFCHNGGSTCAAGTTWGVVATGIGLLSGASFQFDNFKTYSCQGV